MPLTKEQGERLGRCTETFFQQLNQGAAADPSSGYSIHDRPYRPCVGRGDRRDIAFSVSFRAPIGQVHQDTGTKWKTLDGPTWQDAEIVAQTCENDEEVLQQWHNIVFKGIRPMRLRSGLQMNADAINALVEERVRAVLEQKLQAIADGQNTTANAAVRRIEAVEAAETKAWQPPKRKPKRSEVAGKPVSQELLDTWTERAKILEMLSPPLTKHGRIDGRWMSHAQKKWREHLEAQGASKAEASSV